MARIIDSMNDKRRIIRLSTDDVISVVQEYQQIIKGNRNYYDVRDALEDKVIFIPESI